ncbi:MAG: class I SAM-dependent methyltransferase [Leptolinea sp.]|jgi:ubiquinone/menaquinone biosynthesis C-methylase UbiE|nr:class I SAM-dependent methyltransferase [Leptolinea sp.]
MKKDFSSFVKHRWIRLVLWGFDLLYHGFAWMYDFAAWVVSAGKWNDWIRSAGWLADSSGSLLDIGCGKGILLQHAIQRGISAFGLDESPQMLRYSRRLIPDTSRQLIRGLGQAIPIKTGTFQTVTATFPAAYIFEPATLNEIRRVLKPGGQLIILLTSDVTGSSVHERLIRFFSGLFGFGRVADSFQDYLQKPLRECGFMGHMEWISAKNARLLVILAQPV